MVRHFSHRTRLWLLCTLFLVMILALAACGGSVNMAASPSFMHSSGSTSAGSQKAASQTSSLDSPQYLTKTLKVSLQTNDPLHTADDLQTWIVTTDTHATSAGADYEQNGSSYNVTLTFSVSANQYTQIMRYLRDYAPKHAGQLLSLNETIQDVTNDYIDTQSRLSNLHSEQTRLQELISHAQVLGDVITIEDRLTAIEGQIETIESHLKVLNGQTTYYTVMMTIQPNPATSQPTSPAQGGWNILQSFHDAFNSSLGLAQSLLNFFIWLLAFGIYLIPLALIVFFVKRWRKHIPAPAVPKAPKSTLPPSGDL